MSEITLYFYRHGETESNAQGKCAGRTDVPVSKAGMARLNELRQNYIFPDVEMIFSSPAKRCITTAKVYYPNIKPIVYDHLWEVDYGTVDNEPIAVLDKVVGKDRYIAKDPAARYPEGESYLEASFRIRAGMTRVISECISKNANDAAIFIHGDIMETLFMACLETDQARSEFLLCPNGMGYRCRVDSEEWFVDQRIYFEQFIPEGAPRPRVEDSPYFYGM